MNIVTVVRLGRNPSMHEELSVLATLRSRDQINGRNQKAKRVTVSWKKLSRETGKKLTTELAARRSLCDPMLTLQMI